MNRSKDISRWTILWWSVSSVCIAYGKTVNITVSSLCKSKMLLSFLNVGFKKNAVTDQKVHTVYHIPHSCGDGDYHLIKIRIIDHLLWWFILLLQRWDRWTEWGYSGDHESFILYNSLEKSLMVELRTTPLRMKYSFWLSIWTTGERAFSKLPFSPSYHNALIYRAENWSKGSSPY